MKTVTLRNKARVILMLLVALFVIMQIVALTPSLLETSETAEGVPLTALESEPAGVNHAKDIPDRIADYSIDGFHYLSTKAGNKDWDLQASRADLFNKEKVTHAFKIDALIYDPEEKTTHVTGNEARYTSDDRILEVYGDVVTTFSDGFQTKSSYFKYNPTSKKITVPTTEKVTGGGTQPDGQVVQFTSRGMECETSDSKVFLPEGVIVKTFKKTTPKDITEIFSDTAVLYRQKQMATFAMYPNRPAELRFIRIEQDTMFTRSREAELYYGDNSKAKPSPSPSAGASSTAALHDMIAMGDVLVKERRKDGSLRYGTGGRAEFNNAKNTVTLKEFPQVYQDRDTITGDSIILYRNTDFVEVENSNAFSEGTENPSGN